MRWISSSALTGDRVLTVPFKLYRFTAACFSAVLWSSAPARSAGSPLTPLWLLCHFPCSLPLPGPLLYPRQLLHFHSFIQLEIYRHQTWTATGSLTHTLTPALLTSRQAPPPAVSLLPASSASDLTKKIPLWQWVE